VVFAVIFWEIAGILMDLDETAGKSEVSIMALFKFLKAPWLFRF